MNKKVNPNSKEMIKEAVDIIRNTEDDEAAIAFLKDTLKDNYPDLDLGRMDLHEAIEVLGGSEPEEYSQGNRDEIENLSNSLSNFMNSVANKDVKPKKKSKKRRRRRRKRK